MTKPPPSPSDPLRYNPPRNAHDQTPPEASTSHAPPYALTIGNTRPPKGGLRMPKATITALCLASFAAGTASFALAAYYWLERALPHQR